MRAMAAYALCAVAATISCRQQGNALSDTVATTSESTSTVGVTTVPGATVVSPAKSDTAAGAVSVRRSQTSQRSVDQIRADSAKAKADSGRLGRDSIIRFPIRRLPTASSTPSSN
jgi:hypothetical protein